MNSITKTSKITTLWEKIKQHKIITSTVCVAIVAVIVLATVFCIPKSYEIGQEIKGKYLTAKVISIEYTDNPVTNVIGHQKADEGYMFVIINVQVVNNSKNEKNTSPHFEYQNSHSTNVETYPYLTIRPLFIPKKLLPGENAQGYIVYQVRKEINEHQLYFKENNSDRDSITSFKINIPNSNLA